MNELTKELLEVAWKDLPAKKRTLKDLKKEAETDFIIWRNYHVEKLAIAVLPDVQRRPATDYYPDTPLGDACIDWLDSRGFYGWEFPVYDGEDDDFVYFFIARWLAVMAWLAFEDVQEHLDYTDSEIEDFFNFKMNYAPRPKPQKVKAATQLTMF